MTTTNLVPLDGGGDDQPDSPGPTTDKFFRTTIILALVVLVAIFGLIYLAQRPTPVAPKRNDSAILREFQRLYATLLATQQQNGADAESRQAAILAQMNGLAGQINGIPRGGSSVVTVPGPTVFIPAESPTTEPTTTTTTEPCPGLVIGGVCYP